MLTRSPVLVLNQNYQPLNVCDARRAMSLLGRGKAETIEEGSALPPQRNPDLSAAGGHSPHLHGEAADSPSESCPDERSS